MRAALLAALVAIIATPAFAQSPYVAASVGGDIARLSGVDGTTTTGSGEAVSWSLRVGTPVASRFGVELEFTRPQEITSTDTPDVRLLGGTYTVIAESTIVSPIVFPPINVTVRTAKRNTSLSTVAWVRQQVTSRFAMQYLGGIAFTRTSTGFTYNATGVPNVFAALVPRSSRAIDYGVAPVVGAEARIGVTDHLQLVPGIRLQTISGGWLVRPAVALAWAF